MIADSYQDIYTNAPNVEKHNSLSDMKLTSFCMSISASMINLNSVLLLQLSLFVMFPYGWITLKSCVYSVTVTVIFNRKPTKGGLQKLRYSLVSFMSGGKEMVGRRVYFSFSGKYKFCL